MKHRRVWKGCLLGAVLALAPVVIPVAQGVAARCFGETATLVGTPRADKIRGTPRDDVILGLRGNDVIDGRGGNDLICGGPGNDRASGGSGNDSVSGDKGDDALSGKSGNDRLFGRDGIDRIDGGKGDDLIDSGSGIDTCLNGENGEACAEEPTLTFEEGVPPDQQALFSDATGMAVGYLREVAAVAVDGFTVVAAASDGGGMTAQTGGGTIEVFTGSRGWKEAPTHARFKIIAHEYFHLVQEGLSLHLFGSEAQWLREGSAELVGFLTIDDGALYEFETAKAEMIAEARLVTGPLPECVAPEGHTPCVYTLGFVAVDFLIANAGGPGTLVVFWNGIGDAMSWEAAFDTAYGQSVEDFYAAFEKYRAGL